MYQLLRFYNKPDEPIQRASYNLTQMPTASKSSEIILFLRRLCRMVIMTKSRHHKEPVLTTSVVTLLFCDLSVCKVHGSSPILQRPLRNKYQLLRCV